MNDDMLKEYFLKHPEGVMETFRDTIKKIGFETMCSLSDEFGGSSIYIPTKKRLFSGCLSEEIKLEFDGSNLKKLARKYDFSERTIRNITDNKKRY